MHFSTGVNAPDLPSRKSSKPLRRFFSFCVVSTQLCPQLARGEESRLGALLDWVLDRVADVILFGCLFWSPAGQGLRLEAALALITLVIALCVSHVRAEAEAAGVELTEGYFQRLERYVAMMIGLPVPGALLPMLIVLTVLGTVTLAQRVFSAETRVAALSDVPDQIHASQPSSPEVTPPL